MRLMSILTGKSEVTVGIANLAQVVARAGGRVRSAPRNWRLHLTSAMFKEAIAVNPSSSARLQSTPPPSGLTARGS